MTANVREFRQQELAEMEQRMQVFYQTIQKELQAKQVELLQPVQNKLLEAINKVAAAQTCTYVVDRASVLYVGADATDLTPAVRAELGIK
jgi:outer membrane protein